MTSTSLLLSITLAFGTSLISSEAVAKPYTKAYRANYNSVWKATLIALSKYPLETNEQTSGEITTSMIEGDQVFKPYNRTLSSNEHYRLDLTIEKRKLRGQKIVVVKIEKKPTLKGDFMQEDIVVDSDGIEESILLYRISRELMIDRAVEKVFK